jgi:hypothetical protein
LTISTTSSSIQVAGDGLNSSFTFPFVADSADNILVQYINANGIQTTLNPSQYTLVINPAGPNQLWGVGGTITYPLVGSPIAAGTYLLIQRTLPLTQETTVRNQGNYYAQVTEQALDIIEMQLQQVSARTGQLRGVWVTGTDYNYGDIVQDGVNGDDTGNYYTCVIPNTSGTWSTDLAAGNWSLGFNVQQVEQYADEAAASAAAALVSQNAAASSASSASTSATTATTQAGIATTQAGIATTQASAAAVSASQAANYAASYSGTSTTSLAIGSGAKIFTTQTDKLWVSGQFLQIASNANAANYMHGTVTSYSGATLTMNITDTGGSGTYADWNISISGTQGPTGSGAAFNAISSGTNTAAAMVVGTGAALSASGAGTISATSVPAAGITAGTAAINISGNAATVTTNANLTGPITSIGNATAIGAQTGTGSVFAMQAVPSFSTTIGVGSATAAGSGAGISFPATQSASSNANTLDDYEEGVWTPVVTFAVPGDLSVAYSIQNGFYTKIGREVFIRFSIATSSFTHTTASGSLQVTGLPYTSDSASNSFSSSAIGSWQGITKANYAQLAGVVSPSSSLITFQLSAQGQTTATVTQVEAPTASALQLFFNGSYQTTT